MRTGEGMGMGERMGAGKERIGGAWSALRRRGAGACQLALALAPAERGEREKKRRGAARARAPFWSERSSRMTQFDSTCSGLPHHRLKGSARASARTKAGPRASARARLGARTKAGARASAWARARRGSAELGRRCDGGSRRVPAGAGTGACRVGREGEEAAKGGESSSSFLE